MANPSRGGVAGASLDLQAMDQQAAKPKNLIQRVGAKVGEYFGWMPAGEPMPVVVPGIEPRITDFPTFWNRQMPSAGKSRDAGGVTFAQLRALSRQTHVRVVLETVKDRQSKVEYTYTLKSEAGEKTSATRKRAKEDPRIDQVEDFFRAPDRQHDWIDWQRDMLEQVLVCDNLSLLRREYQYEDARRIFFGEERNEPWGVEIIDGDTIFPLIDDTGRRPLPPAPAYEQWIKGLVVGRFSADELMYCPRNVAANRIYSAGSPVEQLLFYVNLIIRRDLTKLDFYTKGNMPAGFMPTPPQWNLQQVREFTDWLNSMLMGDQEQRAKIVPIPGGVGKVDYAQKEILQDTFDDAWLRLVCFCFSIPVSSLVREQTRATADTSKQEAIEAGAIVITNWIAKLQTKIIRQWFGWPDIVVVPKEQTEIDPIKRSTIYDIAIKNGTLQIDEVREDEGLDPLNLPPGYMSAQGFETFESAIATPEGDGDPTSATAAPTEINAHGKPKDSELEAGATKFAKRKKKRLGSRDRRSSRTAYRY